MHLVSHLHSSIDEELIIDLFSIDEESHDIRAPQFLDAR